ncbi:MAG: DedA family protein [Acidobacteria bacterium]|nr:DedA family protein [Acidobacteriota bacterium]
MLITSAFDTLQRFGPVLVYPGMYGLLLLSAVGMPLPEDLTLAAAGYLISKDLMSPLPAALVGVLGVMTGDQFAYSLGKHFGPKVVAHRWVSHVLSPQRYEWVRARFARHGSKMVFLARFVSGLRGPAFIAAGVLQMPRGKFLLYDLAGALLNVPLFMLAGYLAGPHLESVVLDVHRAWRLVMALLVLVAAYFALSSLARKRLGINGNGGERGSGGRTS